MRSYDRKFRGAQDTKKKHEVHPRSDSGKSGMDFCSCDAVGGLFLQLADLDVPVRRFDFNLVTAPIKGVGAKR